MNKRKTGAVYEQKAAEYLEKAGDPGDELPVQGR